MEKSIMRATYGQIPNFIAELTPFVGNSVTAYTNTKNGRYIVNSYNTVIAEIDIASRKPVYFDAKYYSRTTSRLQNILRDCFDMSSFEE